MRSNLVAITGGVLLSVAGALSAGEAAKPPEHGTGKGVAEREKELAALQTALKQDPDDGDALAKIIPLFQGLQKSKEAGEALARLRKLHEANRYLPTQVLREEFAVADCFDGSKPIKCTVRALEYFRPTAGRTTSRYPVLWEFEVLDEQGETARRVFLEISAVVSKSRGKTVYSLDENHLEKGRFVFHASYGFREDVPKYEDLKSEAVTIIEGRKAALSSSGKPSTRYAEKAPQAAPGK